MLHEPVVCGEDSGKKWRTMHGDQSVTGPHSAGMSLIITAAHSAKKAKQEVRAST
jgi:hypothetical protein